MWSYPDPNCAAIAGFGAMLPAEGAQALMMALDVAADRREPDADGNPQPKGPTPRRRARATRHRRPQPVRGLPQLPRTPRRTRHALSSRTTITAVDLPRYAGLRPSIQVSRRAVHPARTRQPTRRTRRPRTDPRRAGPPPGRRPHRHLAPPGHRPARQTHRLRPHRLQTTRSTPRLHHRPRPHLPIHVLQPPRLPLRNRPHRLLGRRRPHQRTRPASPVLPTSPLQTRKRLDRRTPDPTAPPSGPTPPAAPTPSTPPRTPSTERLSSRTTRTSGRPTWREAICALNDRWAQLLRQLRRGGSDRGAGHVERRLVGLPRTHVVEIPAAVPSKRCSRGRRNAACRPGIRPARPRTVRRCSAVHDRADIERRRAVGATR